MSFRFGLGFVFAVVVLIITGNIYFGIIAYLIGSFLDFRNNPNEKKRAELTLELLQHFTYLLGHLLRVSGKNNKENFDLLCHHFVDVFSALQIAILYLVLRDTTSKRDFKALENYHK